MIENQLHEGEEPPPPGVRTAGMFRWAMLAIALLGAGYTVLLATGVVGGASAAAVQYHCPMHPTVVSDVPGECPICGMDLVPIDGGASGSEHAHGHDHGDADGSIARAAKQLGARPGQWICPMPEDGVVRDEPGRCEKCGMSLVQVPGDDTRGQEGPAIYSCPMHPEVEHEGPGKCPKCGMYLVRKAADGAQAEQGVAPGHAHPAAGESHEHSAEAGKGVPGLTEVVIPSERLARIGVRTAKVERGRLEGQVRTVGVVAPDERRRYVVQARFSGWIEKLLVDETGATVRTGEPLLQIYSPELYQAQVEYLNALKWSPELQDAASQRLRLLGIAEADLAALRKAGKAQRTMTLRAPGAGHVLRKGAIAGAYVSPGDVLFEVADLSRIWVLADVFEQEIPRVQVGATATFAAAAHPGDRFVGKVSFVYPTVEPSTRTMKVRLEIANASIALRPGMFGDVRLDVEAPEGAIVPRDAVIDSGEHVYAIVARGGGRFTPREVHITGRAGDHVMVVGLDDGEEVVTGAGFFIDSESRLRAALAGMGGGHDHGDLKDSRALAEPGAEKTKGVTP
ncbi:putative Co/Zn/Cd efflux system membrane fusion protein [Vulgatibacter incomptus]|uniref:Putative Co/Zn/Cd efflux system membrane fusion protein n=2 Tax=Vulgatibacter incomptus TaxID=1391653 RepID=A0A0K1PD04_9BACT|nr:putative Co/Zn/Cd efflux system membrane fusion protein [Vulgatibacter incomptus]